MTNGAVGAREDDRVGLAPLIVFGAISMPVSLLAIGFFMFVPRVYSSLGGISIDLPPLTGPF
jgi:hypothetical protein